VSSKDWRRTKDSRLQRSTVLTELSHLSTVSYRIQLNNTC